MSAATAATTSVFANSVEEIMCAICLDSVDISMNVIKTECKHCFHSTCFLQNAAHNGFNCPMCRNELAEVPSDDDDDDDDCDSDDDDDDDDEEEVEDFALRGARWLMMRAEGEEIDEDDTDNESIDSYDEEGFIRYEDESVPIVSIDQVTALLEQNNVSYKELVAFLILPDSRHQSDLQEYNSARMKQIAALCSSLNI